MAAITDIKDAEIQKVRRSLKVGVAIPTYNEKVNLQLVIDRLQKVFKNNSIDGRIVVVDDNSSDGTGKLADVLAKTTKNISVIHRAGKFGLGSAYKEAFHFLLKDPEINVVMEMDADLSHEPEYIPSMLDMIVEGSDVVIGSRYVAKGGVDDNWAPMRQLISKSANFLTKLLVGLNVKDATSGFRAYDSVALKSVDFSSVRTNGYAFQIDMLFHCRNVGCEITEVPIIFRERKHGTSKLGSFAILEFLKTLEGSFAKRITFAIFDTIQTSTVSISNSLWIGIKPLRVAIKQANESNHAFSKGDKVFSR